MRNIIRTSRHFLSFSNSGKLTELQSFLKEYRRIAQLYLNYLWEHGIRIITHKQDKSTFYHFDTNTNLECPIYVSTVLMDKELGLKTFLTARVRKCIINQVVGIIRGTIEKQRKRQFIANLKRTQKKKVNRYLRKALRKNKPAKPDVSKINPEIGSICFDYQPDNRHFDGWLKLFSYNIERGRSVKFPIKHHRHSKRMKQQGTMMKSFLLSDKYVDIRWEMHKTKPTGILVVGGDPGERNVLTLNDGQTTPGTSQHKWTLRKIEDRISGKRRGSKAIKKCYKHRTNFINWSINQLDFSNIKELRYEKNKDVRKYKSCYHGSWLSHWAYAAIHLKVKLKCETEEVLYVPHGDSTYMSQRCHVCGLVLKSNRVGGTYSCENCGWVGCSDYNAASNHQQDLVELPYGFRKLKLNRTGFFWKETGLFSLAGEEFAVPLSENED